MEKAVFYHFLYFLGHTFFLTPTVKVCHFKAGIYLDTHFLLNYDVMYLIKYLLHFFFLFFFFLFCFFQESVGLLGPVEIHVRRIESANDVLPTYIRI